MSDRPRVVVVTGASRGIGAAIARSFASEGARVALLARSREPLERLAAELGGDRTLVVEVDVADSGSVERAVGVVTARWQRIDVLVNNAGLGGLVALDETAADAVSRWTRIVDTNLLGTYHVTRIALPHVPVHADGRIVSVASVLGRFGVAFHSAYTASKHAVIGLTRAWAVELAPRGITVNAVCPGWVATEMAEQSVRETAQRLGVATEEFRRQALEQVPQRRFLEPEEVAELVTFLARPSSRGITGQAYVIAAGAYQA